MPRKKVEKTVAQDVQAEEQLRDAETIVNKSSIGEVIENTETTMTVSQELGRDKVRVYDTKTGQPSIVLKYMLKKQLEKKHADGSPAFTVNDPEVPQKVGKYKCLLHPEDEHRQEWTDMGLTECKKSNLISEYHRDRHMQKKHKDEWNVIQAWFKKQEAEEQKAFQRGLLEKVAK